MDPDEQKSFATAARIVDRLLEGDIRDEDLPEEVALADLESDADDFAVELGVLAHGGLAPAVNLDGEGPIPVALSLIVAPPWDPMESPLREWRGTSAFDGWANDVLQSLAEKRPEDDDVELLPIDDVRAGFMRRATGFLAVRINAVRGLAGEGWATARLLVPRRVGHAPTPVPGCNFSVATNTHGLRVVYSGAYRRSKLAFGSPTTPVRSTLQSGDYMFGVDGGAYGQRGRWDNAIVTLPGPPSVHLHF